MHPESLYAHLLLCQPGLGAAGLQALHDQFGSFFGVLSARPNELPHRWRSPLSRLQKHLDPLREEAQKTIDGLQQSGVSLICLSDMAYPALLRETASPPPLLYVRGNSAALTLPTLAIVGSRHASRGGIEQATRFAASLAGGGFAVASGLAKGIDSAAHRGALSSGITIAVVGTGIDRCYPKSNQQLADSILNNDGVIVSELPPGTPPAASNFPRRNRIISGLSVGVLVVEAALKSGSLITARLAMEQGREVYAIPGSINNPLAKGCHQLIREGANLTETAGDIVEQLQGLLSFKQEEVLSVSEQPEESDKIATLKPSAQYLLTLIGYDPVDIDTLAHHSKLSTAELSGLLAELEILGLVENRSGIYQRIH